jgi:hypothetical protein
MEAEKLTVEGGGVAGLAGEMQRLKRVSHVSACVCCAPEGSLVDSNFTSVRVWSRCAGPCIPLTN